MQLFSPNIGAHAIHIWLLKMEHEFVLSFGKKYHLQLTQSTPIDGGKLAVVLWVIASQCIIGNINIQKSELTQNSAFDYLIF